MNPPGRVHVSIIIPTKNAGALLDRVLKAVFDNAIGGGFEFEVIVVDSGSSDCTKAIIARYPVKLIEISPLSFSHGGARNLGAENSKGEFLVFLSQDAIPNDRSWMTSLIGNFDDEAVSGVYGRQVPPHEAAPIEKFFLYYLYPAQRMIKSSIDPADCLLSDIFFSNVNSAIRRTEWEETRFNDELIMSEDQEWSRRILMKGKKIVYEPHAVVIHSHRYNLFAIISRNFDSGMSLKGLVGAPIRRVLGYDLRYIGSGFSFFIKNGNYLHLLIFPFYELARLIGFTMGFFSKCLPLWLKKFISQNKIYWLRAQENRLRR